MEPFCNHAKIISCTFNLNNLKNLGFFRFLMKLSIFAVLVCAYHKESFTLIPYVLKTTLNFKIIKKQLVAQLKIYKINLISQKSFTLL